VFPGSNIPGELLARLARFGRIYVLDSIPSTNTYALDLAEKEEPAVVIAQNQTHGRGRFRRHWFSNTDSLTFSLLLFRSPEDPPSKPPQLTQLAGLAVCRAIEDVTGLEPLIRWPNDVVCSGKKLAGMLCEQRGNAIVVGMGVNVNQPEFPEELPEAGSLRMLSGRPWERLEILERTLEHFTHGLAAIQEERWPELLLQIKNRSGVLHRRVEVRTLFRRHIGTVVDIDPEGRIVLRTSNGRLVIVSSGQARTLR
jgi:BirA family biotin operon repressor/biotin-[acetyl-CoA-carboxylase] ligase